MELQMRLTVLALAILSSFCACTAADDAEGSSQSVGGYGEELAVLRADPHGVLIGEYRSKQSTVRFEVNIGPRRALEQVVLIPETAGDDLSVKFEAGEVSEVAIGDTDWAPEDGPPPKARLDALHAGGVSRALPYISAHLYWALPTRDFRPHRVALLSIYSKLAPHLEPGDKVLSQLDGTALSSCLLDICAVKTPEALFGCEWGDELHRDIVPLIDGLPPGCVVGMPDGSPMPDVDGVPVDVHHQDLHEAGACYGACGGSCGGACRAIPIGCNPADIRWPEGGLRDGAEATSGARACYRVQRFLRVGDVTPEDDFRADYGECPEAYLTQNEFIACTTAECCFRHDECTRHDNITADGQIDWLTPASVLCQDWGVARENGCGIRALQGKPSGGWGIKWFSDRRRPIETGNWGVCQWHARCVGGQCRPELVGYLRPSEIDHEQWEQAICPVHACKHGFDARCRQDAVHDHLPTEGPQVDVVPRTGVRGRDEFHQSGIGFAPNSTVSCTGYRVGEDAGRFDIHVDFDGRFVKTYRPGFDKPAGDYLFSCVDEFGVDSNEAPFEILATPVHAARPNCGDRVCSGTENRNTCPEDCGLCIGQQNDRNWGVVAQGDGHLYAVAGRCSHQIVSLPSFDALGVSHVDITRAEFDGCYEPCRSLDGGHDRPLLKLPSEAAVYMLDQGRLRAFDDEAAYRSCSGEVGFERVFSHATRALLEELGGVEPEGLCAPAVESPCEDGGVRRCKDNCDWGECAGSCDCQDGDGDGFLPLGCENGDCELPRTDCDDDDRTVHSGHVELCDGQDNDCDGQTDENLSRACNSVCGAGQEMCSNGQWHNCNAPLSEAEICDDQDNDCDGQTDENLTRDCNSV